MPITCLKLISCKARNSKLNLKQIWVPSCTALCRASCPITDHCTELSDQSDMANREVLFKPVRLSDNSSREPGRPTNSQRANADWFVYRFKRGKKKSTLKEKVWLSYLQLCFYLVFPVSSGFKSCKTHTGYVYLGIPFKRAA